MPKVEKEVKSETPSVTKEEGIKGVVYFYCRGKGWGYWYGGFGFGARVGGQLR